MGCTDDDVAVERTVELEGSPERVWEELPGWLDEEDRERVLDECEPARRLSFWWMTRDGGNPPSYVEIDLEPSAVGTLLHVRETLLDGAHLVRSAFRALART